MQKYSIRPFHPEEFDDIFARIRHDFAPGEYPPPAVLRGQLKSGKAEGLLLEEDDGAGRRPVAYATTARQPGGAYCLVSLLAVFDGARGKGHGSAFLRALRGYYAGSAGLIVEVERPDNAEEAERAIRLRRIRFYERAGFFLVPGVEYRIWGVPMHLMGLPLGVSAEKMDAELDTVMREIYAVLLGKHFMHQFDLRREPAPERKE